MPLQKCAPNQNVSPQHQHPLLLRVPQHDGSILYTGFVDLGESHEYSLRLAVPADGALKGARFEPDWRLARLLPAHESVVKQRLSQSLTAADFVQELRQLVGPLIPHLSHAAVAPTAFYGTLIAELDALGWSFLRDLSPDLLTLTLVRFDAAKREHLCRVVLRPGYPVLAPVCAVDLPVPLVLKWPPASNLAVLARQVDVALALYQDLWDVLDDLDTHTWVLEPAVFTRGSVARRIVVAATVALQVQLDPVHARAFPSCRFLGPEFAVSPLRSALHSGASRWDNSLTPRENLEQILAYRFPPRGAKEINLDLECGICYSYLLDGQAPDKVCDEKRCSKAFHTLCLQEWLRALPETRQSFSTLFGECPYCSKPITLKVVVT